MHSVHGSLLRRRSHSRSVLLAYHAVIVVDMKGKLSQQFLHTLSCTRVSTHCILTLSARIFWKAEKKCLFFLERNLMRIRWHFSPPASAFETKMCNFFFIFSTLRNSRLCSTFDRGRKTCAKIFRHPARKQGIRVYTFRYENSPEPGAEFSSARGDVVA